MNINEQEAEEKQDNSNIPLPDLSINVEQAAFDIIDRSNVNGVDAMMEAFSYYAKIYMTMLMAISTLAVRGGAPERAIDVMLEGHDTLRRDALEHMQGMVASYREEADNAPA